MAQFPAFPLWTDAYLADCSHLSEAEHGRYLLFLIHLWRAPNQRFPNDDSWLARKFTQTESWVAELLRPLITEFCDCDGNWIKQNRLSKEWRYLKKQSKQRSDAAKSRWNKEKTPSGDDAGPHKSRNPPTPTPTPTPLEQEVPLAKANGCAPSAAAPAKFFEMDIPPALDRRTPKEPATPKPKIDPWKAVYDRGKEVLGQHAGGQITKLRKLYEDKPSRCLAKIEDSAEHRDPAAWMARFLFNVDDGGRLAGEYIGGIPPP